MSIGKTRRPPASVSSVNDLIGKLQSIQIGADPTQRFKHRDLILLFRNLTTLVENGVSLPHALETVAADKSLKKYKRILGPLSREVKSGVALSVAMKAFPQAFHAMLVNQIRVGERSGTIDDTLVRVTKQIELSEGLKKSIIKKLTYPFILVAAGIGSVTFMLLYVIPTFQKMYEEANATLPAITQWLIAIGDFVRANGVIVVGSLVAFLVVSIVTFRTPSTRVWVDRHSLRIPLLGDWLSKIAILQFMDVLGNLMESGFNLAEALPQAANSVSNRHVRRKILGLSTAIRRGERFSRALEKEGDLFPAVVNQLVIVGERTGRLAIVTRQIRTHLRRDVEASTNRMVGSIEPILTVGLAVVVGGILLAVYLPMFDMIGQSH